MYINNFSTLKVRKDVSLLQYSILERHQSHYETANTAVANSFATLIIIKINSTAYSEYALSGEKQAILVERKKQVRAN